LAIQYIKKRGGIRKPGLSSLRPAEFGRLTSSKRTVSRPYGGVLGHDEVKER
jgi:ribosomal protein L34E